MRVNTDYSSEFAENMGFTIRKTTPYNPQSNPVERVMLPPSVGYELASVVR